MNNDRKSVVKAHIFMICLVTLWGLDYVVAKGGLDFFTPMSLLFCKYSIGCTLVFIIKLAQKNRKIVRVKDIPLFLLCAFFGQVMYFNCEYNAIQYIPVSLVSIILTFLPVVSIMIESIIFKKRPNKKIVTGMTICVLGVILVIGADASELFTGRAIGYLLAFGAMISWNIYNFITSSLKEYDSVTLASTQMLCSLLMIGPVAIKNMPPLEEFTASDIGTVIYLGVGAAGIGYLIMVYGLKHLGPTTAALYSDFLPVTTTFFGWVFLNESISALQIAGGIIVIAAGYIVIKEKGKMEEESNGSKRKDEPDHAH